MTDYDNGDLVRAATAFTNSGGSAADPSNITVKYRIGAGVISSYVYGTDAEVVRDSVGNYHIDILMENPGVYHIRWEGTGTVTAADEDTWIVKQSRLI